MIACAWSLAASESNYSWSPDVLEKHLKHAGAKQAASIDVSLTRDDGDYVPASARTTVGTRADSGEQNGQAGHKLKRFLG